MTTITLWLVKEMATHSSVLAWRIPGTGEPGGLPSVGLHRVGHDCSDLAAAGFKRLLLGRKATTNLLLSRFSRVRLCATPEMAAHQAPPSLGFFRKITEVGYHFLLQCMKVKSQSEVTQSCPTQGPHGLQPNRLLCPWDFPGKNKVLHIKES